MPSFVHLNVHSEYSIVDGLVRIKPLVTAVAKAKMEAVAITDRLNLFAVVKFYQAAITMGIKPIIGTDVWLENEDQPQLPHRLILLCQNEIGYKNLTQLISKAYLTSNYSVTPLLQRTWLKGATEGLIALSGGREGSVGRALLAGRHEHAEQLLKEWQLLFPDRYYLELQRTQRQYEDVYLELAIGLAGRCDVPVVATNAVCFLKESEFEAHEARVCIHSGHILDDERRPKNYSQYQYLRDQDEMRELFADLPTALENTVEIAKRCNFELPLGNVYLPNYPLKSTMSLVEYLAAQAQQGLIERLSFGLDQPLKLEAIPETYQLRLQTELKVINSMGFASYFLIVADFIRWAREHQVPVGPGRGSGAGSLVAYALKITDLDPLKYDLLFERFLNPERVSMPDFDIDFCMEGRDRVIEYVAETYGRDSVAQIITYGSMAAKAVVRDVGRVLGYPYGFVDKIAKLIPFEIGITLTRALAQEAELQERYNQEEEVKTLLDLAKTLEGITRNAGKHAGGVVIAPSKLTDFTPLYCEAGGHNVVTQFDKDDIEAVGLVKFDFLGLRTLTVIDWTVQSINAKCCHTGQLEVDINRILLDDKKTFDLLKACITTAVFQLESRGIKDLIKRLQPDCFEEIIALVALFRPGPLQSGMVDDFIDCKHGRAKVVYPHPILEPILRSTYGVILYQEQVMQIAQVLGGYTLGAADLLRRAMGKKKPEEMAKHRQSFIAGAVEKGVEQATAGSIFDLMEKFAGYGFNKSHSAAYALLAYQTAWLKAHYPAFYMAAVLSADMNHTDKILILVEECCKLGIKIHPPSINQSYYKFMADTSHSIRYGLGAIKSVGEAAVTMIVASREKKGHFTDLFDLCCQIDLRKINKRSLEALIKAGALDELGTHRASLIASLNMALSVAEQQSRHQLSGQNDLFADNYQTITEDIAYVAAKQWSDEQRLQGEKESLGFYLTGHPIDRYRNELSQFVTSSIKLLKPTANQFITIAGFITHLKAMHTKRGERMLFVTLDDGSGRLELAIFSDLYATNRPLLIKDQLLLVEGEVSLDEYSGTYKMSARRLFKLEDLRKTHGSYLLLRLSEAATNQDTLKELASIIKPFCKDNLLPIAIEYQLKNIRALLPLGKHWRIEPEERLFQILKEFLGAENVVMCY